MLSQLRHHAELTIVAAWEAGPVTTVTAALRAAAAFGPYFAVELSAEGPGWSRLHTLVEDPTRLRERVAIARALIAGRSGQAPDSIDERATASTYFLGLAARLVSPALGAAAFSGTVPVLAVDLVHWQPVEGGPMPIAITGSQTRSAGTPEDIAALLYDDVVSTTVAPVLEAVQREFRLSPKVLWGDVASALAGAAKMLAGAGPLLAWEPVRLAERLLEKGLLAGAGRYVRPDPARPEQHFVRNNCCLFYRIPGGGTCADCVLVPEAARRALWRDQLSGA